MPGFLGGAQNAQPKQPFGQNLKQALISAAPLFSSMAAGYSSGRGPYAYLDQGIAGMQAMQKQKRDEEAAAAAAAAFGGLVPGGMGPAGVSSKGGGYSGKGIWEPKGALPKADVGVFGGGDGGLSFGNLPAADTGVAQGGLSFSQPGTSVPDQIYEGLIARGLSPTAAHGIMMNFQDESAFNSGIVGDNGAALGLAQWNGPRKRALESFAAAKGSSATDINTQLDFLMHELQGPYASTAAALASAATPGEAGAAFLNMFERPAEQHRVAREAKYLGYGGTPGASGGNVTMSAMGEGATPGVADPLSDPYVQQLMKVMAMPGLTPEQQAVVQLQLQTRMGQLTAPNPDADEDRARQRRARDAEMLGYGRGTPEWNQYVISGDVAAPPKPIEVGGVLLDPSGKNVIFDSREPPKPEAPTTKNVTLADGSEVMVQWNPETKVWDAAPIPEGGTTGSGQKLTDSQSKLTLFQTLQTETAPVLLELEKQFDPANLKDPSLSSIPIAGNYFASPEYQMYSTAASAWAEGALRISTGAAATQPEIDRLEKTYFAQPGDTPQTVAFKASMRQMYDRAVNNALGKPNGDGSLMLPSEFADVVGGQMAGGATPAPTVPPPGGVLKFDANGNVIP